MRRADLELPDEPFRLCVSAPGFHPREVVVADPRRRAEEWDVALEALPAVEGVVLWGGEPVAGAFVQVEDVRRERRGADVLERRWWPPEVRGEAQADERGRFRIPLDGGGELLARAMDAGRHGTSAPFAKAAGEGRSDVVVELVERTCSLTGSVLLPEGREPRNVFLYGKGVRGFLIDLAADGSFDIDGLPPGPLVLWAVRRGSAELTERSRLRFRFPTHLALQPLAWADDAPVVRTLVPGEACRFDVDLRAPSTHRLAGRLLVNGRPLDVARDGVELNLAWTPRRHASLEPWTDRGSRGRMDASRAALDDDGRFALAVPSAGTYVLHLDLFLRESWEQWNVYDRVRVDEEPEPWSCDVPQGSPVMRGLDADLREAIARRRASWVWRGPGDLRIHVLGRG